MSLLLNVPYAEKDEAKALGAKWNPELKKWYAVNRKDYYKFKKWILNGRDEIYILCDCFYIIEGIHTCFKCGSKTKVIGFGVKSYFEVYDEDDTLEYVNDEIHIVSHINPLDEKLLSKLEERYGYRSSYSKTVGASYISNHCSNCKMKQGDFFLFSEVDSPYWIDSVDKAKQLTLYKVPLEYDIAVEIDMGWGSNDWMIEEYAKHLAFEWA